MLRRSIPSHTEMTSPTESLLLHASAVAFGSGAVVILGKSGAGKSGLALRLIALGGVLVADDRTWLTRRGDRLIASAPDHLRGMIEARGIGLLRAETVAEAPVELVVDLDFAPAARMPHQREISYLGIAVELISGREAPNLDAALVVLMQYGRIGGV